MRSRWLCVDCGQEFTKKIVQEFPKEVKETPKIEKIYADKVRYFDASELPPHGIDPQPEGFGDPDAPPVHISNEESALFIKSLNSGCIPDESW